MIDTAWIILFKSPGIIVSGKCWSSVIVYKKDSVIKTEKVINDIT
ncbi:MAG: hypothetical protein WCB31_02365 [Nitrososphaeraceae archaeon]